jgi:transposase-like protein
LEQKHAFVQLVSERDSALAEVCRAFRIRRQTGDKWLERYRHSGLSGLADQSRQPHHSPQATAAVWVERLRLVRRRRKCWGPKKLRAWLQGQHPRSRVSSVSILGRRRGPDRAWPALRQARRPNEVWTVDFKGYFHTADGRRCDPLTVRDAYSRYGLCVRVLHGHKLATVQREFVRRFRRFGLPRRIHADPGRLWAGPGPAWLSQLSAWWVSLGIRPTFSCRARPGDNASHEQWHRELKVDNTRPPSATPQAQPRRLQNWLQDSTRSSRMKPLA